MGKFIRISLHTPKNIQEGSAEIICKDIDILSHPKEGRESKQGVRCHFTIRALKKSLLSYYIISLNNLSYASSPSTTPQRTQKLPKEGVKNKTPYFT